MADMEDSVAEATPASTASTKLTSFALFARLPSEIKTLIWLAASVDNDPRIVSLEKRRLGLHRRNRVWSNQEIWDETYFTSGPDGRTVRSGIGKPYHQSQFFTRCRLPVLFHVCYDSRRVAKRMYSKYFGDDVAAPAVWFNPEIDTLYLSLCSRDLYEFFPILGSICVKRLALPCPLWLNVSDYIGLLRQVKGSKCVERVSFVDRQHTPMEAHDLVSVQGALFDVEVATMAYEAACKSSKLITNFDSFQSESDSAVERKICADALKEYSKMAAAIGLDTTITLLDTRIHVSKSRYEKFVRAKEGYEEMARQLEYEAQ